MKRYGDVNIRGFDWITLFVYLSLVGIGWMMVFAVSHSEDQFSVFNISTPIGKQTLWIGVSFIILLATLIVDKNFWRTFSYVIYVLAIVTLLAVLLFGAEIKGARSWISIGGLFYFQPAEFAKFATALALSSYLSTFSTSLRNTGSVLVSIGLIVLPAFLILIQPDAGSAFVFASFFIVLYRAGLSTNVYLLAFSVILLFLFGLVYNPLNVAIALLLIASVMLIQNLDFRRFGYAGIAAVGLFSWVGLRNGLQIEAFACCLILVGLAAAFQIRKKEFRRLITISGMLAAAVSISIASNYVFNNLLEKHQQERVNVWLRPELCDPHGSLYNIMQSKMAIGSGGWSGKGFLKGSLTKFDYVPEQSTDFIFCTIGEEQGFLGSAATILLFVILLNRIVVISEGQRVLFNKYFGYSVAGLLFVHFFVNIGMTMGLVPVVGIPLPFISYGGSSLLFFTVMIGILLKMSSDKV